MKHSSFHRGKGEITITEYTNEQANTMKKRAKIDYTFDDNFNNREDALTKETTVAGLHFARSIKAMNIRVDIVDRAIRNISKS